MTSHEALPPAHGERASHKDFRLIASLIGTKHWDDIEDWKPELPVERARHWLPLVTKAHIPQLALLAHLNNFLFYRKDPEGAGWKALISTLLAKRALVLLALMHAVDNDQPVKWDVSFKTHEEVPM